MRYDDARTKRRWYDRRIELDLTYAFSDNETTALLGSNTELKGQRGRFIRKCIDDISKLSCKVAHPMILPYAMIRSIRRRLNNMSLECAIKTKYMEFSLACNIGEVEAVEGSLNYGKTSDSWNFRQIGRDLADNRRIMISILGSTTALYEAIDRLREAVSSLWSRLSDERKSSEMTAIHAQLARGLKEERAQLDCIVGFAHQLEQRIQVLESTVSDLIYQARDLDTCSLSKYVDMLI